jgi:hypothetical protein
MTLSKPEAMQQWAEAALFALRPMSLDERIHWYASKPAGDMYFNHRRVSYVLRSFPAYREQFEQLGLRIR